MLPMLRNEKISCKDSVFGCGVSRMIFILNLQLMPYLRVCLMILGFMSSIFNLHNFYIYFYKYCGQYARASRGIWC